MAETVTISTFLELRDNMSAGLQRIADALKAATQDAPKAQAALNNIAKQATANSRQVEKAKKDEERAAARAAEMRRRIEINSAKLASDAAQKENEARIKEQHRIDSLNRSQAAKDQIRRELNSIRAEKEAAKQIKAAEKAAEKAAAAQERMRKMAERSAEREARKVEQLKAREAKAMAAQARMDKEKERAAQRAAKNQEMLKERMAMAVVRANQKIEAERKRAERQAEALARKEANAIIREAERAIREKRRIEREAAAAARRSAQQADGGGLFGTMVSANVVANSLTRAASFVFDSIKNMAIRAIEVNVEYEKSISAISSAMYTMGASPSMRTAESHAERVVGKLREMAALLPGEASDYVEVFQRTIPGAFASGMRDSIKYADFVSKYTAVAIQRGISAKVAATNLQILMGGTARAGTKMAQVLAAFTGKTINDLNKMSRAARFDLLQQAVESAAAGMDASKTKADAIFGELKSHLEDLYRIGGQPLFDAAKLGVSELNKLIKENKTAIIELAQVISTNLGESFLGVVNIAKKLVSLLDSGKKETLEERTEFKIPSLGAVFPGLYILEAVRQSGAITKYEQDLARQEKERAQRADWVKTYAPRMVQYKPETILPSFEVPDIADTIQSAFKKGMFEGLPKTPADAIDDYLRMLMVGEEKLQAVHEELLARGVFKITGMAEAPDKRASTVNDFRYSRFDIRQEFAEGFDPDRIAVAFATDLGKLADRKLSAATGGPAVGAH